MVELTNSNTFLDKCSKGVASDAPCGSGLFNYIKKKKIQFVKDLPRETSRHNTAIK